MTWSSVVEGPRCCYWTLEFWRAAMLTLRTCTSSVCGCVSGRCNEGKTAAAAIAGAAVAWSAGPALILAGSGEGCDEVGVALRRKVGWEGRQYGGWDALEECRNGSAEEYDEHRLK